MKTTKGTARKEWPCVTCGKKIKKAAPYILWHTSGKAQRAHEACGQPTKTAQKTKDTKKKVMKKGGK